MNMTAGTAVPVKASLLGLRLLLAFALTAFSAAAPIQSVYSVTNQDDWSGWIQPKFQGFFPDTCAAGVANTSLLSVTAHCTNAATVEKVFSSTIQIKRGATLPSALYYPAKYVCWLIPGTYKYWMMIGGQENWMASHVA